MDSSSIVAIDSWLSVRGQVLAFSAHVDRFARAVEAAGGSRDDAEAAIFSAREETPLDGEFFPRVECSLNAGQFSFEHSVRVSPARLTSAVLWTSPLDPRQQPSVKGPDLAELAGLRLLAAEHGANEAVILAHDAVVEAAHSSIAWWRGDTLCFPDDALPRVDSVTWQVVRTLAMSLGVPLAPERSSPDELAGCEVWVMSALHGIRGVTGWVDGPDLAVPERHELWQARLIALREREDIR